MLFYINMTFKECPFLSVTKEDRKKTSKKLVTVWMTWEK